MSLPTQSHLPAVRNINNTVMVYSNHVNPSGWGSSLWNAAKKVLGTTTKTITGVDVPCAIGCAVSLAKCIGADDKVQCLIDTGASDCVKCL